MRGSLRLLTIRGIDIRLHFTFPLILLWAALQFGLLAGDIAGALFGIITITILFFIVTLHELGHSLAAQYYEVPVKQIILSPIGGLAQLDHIPEKPIQEFIIAIAGPAVNLLVAVAMALVLATPAAELRNPSSVLLGITGISFSALFSYIFFYNILLAVFNLIPAFPLDGGRIFRSLLAMRLNYSTATKIAATLGQIIAVVIGIYGLFSGAVFLAFIAFFIFVGATQEASEVKAKTLLRSSTVEDVYSAAVYKLSPESTVQQARNFMVFGRQRNFPVVDGDTLVGFITHYDLLKATRISVPHARVSTIMQKSIRPVSCKEDLYGVHQRFVKEQINALPVVEDSHFLGMITRNHIAKHMRLMSSPPKIIIHNQSA